MVGACVGRVGEYGCVEEGEETDAEEGTGDVDACGAGVGAVEPGGGGEAEEAGCHCSAGCVGSGWVLAIEGLMLGGKWWGEMIDDRDGVVVVVDDEDESLESMKNDLNLARILTTIKLEQPTFTILKQVYLLNPFASIDRLIQWPPLHDVHPPHLNQSPKSPPLPPPTHPPLPPILHLHLPPFQTLAPSCCHPRSRPRRKLPQRQRSRGPKDRTSPNQPKTIHHN